MMIRNMPSKTLLLGEYKRPDSEAFEIKVFLYTTSLEMDYWICVFEAAHAEWRHMRFQANVPKRIAPDQEHLIALVTNSVATEVKTRLDEATSKGRNLNITFSPDGWTLI